MKKVLVTIVAVLLVFSLVACSAPAEEAATEAPSEEAATEAPAEEPSEAPAEESEAPAEEASEAPAAGSYGGIETITGDWTIAVVVKDATNPWHIRGMEGVEQFAADTGINAIAKGPAESDATAQVQVIEDLIAQGVDALCVVPLDPAATETVLKKAMDQDIVVLTHEGATTENMDYGVEAFNNEGYGAFIMDNLAREMGEEGIYTTMVAHVTNASHNQWADAGVARQEEAYPNMTLLAEEPRVEMDDNQETAYQKAKELIKKYPDLKGIFGTSAFCVPAVARAIEELGLQGKFFTAGTGMPQEVKPALEAGIVDQAILWDAAQANYAMCVLAVRMLNGEEIVEPVDLIAPGYEALTFSSEYPNVLEGQAWITVTLENVDEWDF